MADREAVVSVAILILPGFSIGEFSQVADALSLANRAGATARFHWDAYGVEEGRVASSAGIDVACKASMQLRQMGLNLVIVGPRPRDLVAWSKVASAVRFCHRHNGFILGIGEAVEALALLGLLSGKRASAHWDARPGLRECHRDVDFVDSIFAVDGSVATCAGGGATADFALEFVARFAGHAIADGLACDLKGDPRRRADRSQRKTRLARFAGAHAGFLSAIETIQGTEDKDLDVGRIAATAGVSPRQLQRLFKRYLERTPTECLRADRLKRAKELLTQTPMSIMEVALATGFESPTHFTRQYSKTFGQTPSAARRESWV
jgi:transcriptional regulator GlxA family with amidase domain